MRSKSFERAVLSQTIELRVQEEVQTIHTLMFTAFKKLVDYQKQFKEGEDEPEAEGAQTLDGVLSRVRCACDAEDMKLASWESLRTDFQTALSDLLPSAEAKAAKAAAAAGKAAVEEAERRHAAEVKSSAEAERVRGELLGMAQRQAAGDARVKELEGAVRALEAKLTLDQHVLLDSHQAGERLSLTELRADGERIEALRCAKLSSGIADIRQAESCVINAVFAAAEAAKAAAVAAKEAAELAAKAAAEVAAKRTPVVAVTSTGCCAPSASVTVHPLLAPQPAVTVLRTSEATLLHVHPLPAPQPAVTAPSTSEAALLQAQKVLAEMQAVPLPANVFDLDICVVFDATASMGRELNTSVAFAQALESLLGAPKQARSGSTDDVSLTDAMRHRRLRLSAVAYRDDSARVPLQSLDFTEQPGPWREFLGGLRPSGNSDWVEDAESGLRAASSFAWTPDSAAQHTYRILLWFLDSPPHGQDWHDFGSANDLHYSRPPQALEDIVAGLGSSGIMLDVFCVRDSLDYLGKTRERVNAAYARGTLAAEALTAGSDGSRAAAPSILNSPQKTSTVRWHNLKDFEVPGAKVSPALLSTFLQSVYMRIKQLSARRGGFPVAQLKDAETVCVPLLQAAAEQAPPPDLELEAALRIEEALVASAREELLEKKREDDLLPPPPGVFDLDCAIVFDATGSMGRALNTSVTFAEAVLRYIESLKSVSSIGSSSGGCAATATLRSLRFAVVGYRDKKDARALELLPFTRDINNVTDFMKTLTPMGGGDWPEDVEGALGAVGSLEWPQVRAPHKLQLALLFLDAPPHGSAFHDFPQADDFPQQSPIVLRSHLQALALRGVALDIFCVNGSFPYLGKFAREVASAYRVAAGVNRPSPDTYGGSTGGGAGVGVFSGDGPPPPQPFLILRRLGTPRSWCTPCYLSPFCAPCTATCLTARALLALVVIVLLLAGALCFLPLTRMH